MAWIEERMGQGCTFIDIGNPSGTGVHSEFYYQETLRVFGEGGGRGY